MFSYRKTISQPTLDAFRRSLGNFRSYTNTKKTRIRKVKASQIVEENSGNPRSPQKLRDSPQKTTKSAVKAQYLPKRVGSTKIEKNYSKTFAYSTPSEASEKSGLISPSLVSERNSPGKQSAPNTHQSSLQRKSPRKKTGSNSPNKPPQSIRRWNSASSLDKSLQFNALASPMHRCNSDLYNEQFERTTLADEIQRTVMLESKLLDEKFKYKRLEDKYKKLLSNFYKSESDFENEVNGLNEQLEDIHAAEQERKLKIETLDDYLRQMKDLLNVAEDIAKDLNK